MFSISGDSGDQWRMGTLNVNPAAEFYFIIEGKKNKILFRNYFLFLKRCSWW